jgi:high-affinity iron transporter
MVEALIITFREGVEAALLVGIIVAFLRKEGRAASLKWVWAGLVAAVAASIAGAIFLRRWAVEEALFEGIVFLVSAVVVTSMLVWMWRHGRQVTGEIRGSLARIVERESSAMVGWGLFLFTFLMVAREGVETVLFLAAVSLTTTGTMSAIGIVVGLLLAVAFGVLFVRGSLRIDLVRFLRVTAIALLLFVVQLVVNGVYELAEAGRVPGSFQVEDALAPIVSHDVFFLVAIVALPVLALLWPRRGRSAPPSPPTVAGAPATAPR